MDSEKLGMLCAFLAAVTWAIGVERYSMWAKIYSPSVINFTRAIVSAPCFLVVGLIYLGPFDFWNEWSELSGGSHFWILLSTLSSYAFADALFVWSTRGVGTPKALALASIYPIWSALSGVVFLGQSLQPLQFLGLAFVIGFTIVIILHQAAKTDSSPGSGVQRRLRPTVGIALALSTSLLWALNTFAMNRLGHIDLTVLSLYRMTIAIFLCLPIGKLMGLSAQLIPWKELRPLVPLVLAEAFLGAYFYAYGMSRSPLAVGAALASLSPVIVLPIAIVFGGERVSRLTVLSVIGIVVGVWLLI